MWFKQRKPKRPHSSSPPRYSTLGKSCPCHKCKHHRYSPSPQKNPVLIFCMSLFRRIVAQYPKLFFPHCMYICVSFLLLLRSLGNVVVVHDLQWNPPSSFPDRKPLAPSLQSVLWLHLIDLIICSTKSLHNLPLLPPHPPPTSVCHSESESGSPRLSGNT